MLYDGNTAIWASDTSGASTGNAVMQADGNFVVYDQGGNPVFDTATQGNPGAYLQVQNDGNLVVYAGGRALWASDTTRD